MKKKTTIICFVIFLILLAFRFIWMDRFEYINVSPLRFLKINRITGKIITFSALDFKKVDVKDIKKKVDPLHELFKNK